MSTPFVSDRHTLVTSVLFRKRVAKSLIIATLLALLPFNNSASAVSISGGGCTAEVGNSTNVVIGNNAGWCTIEFKNTGSNSWTAPSDVSYIKLIVVGGGGGGGGRDWSGGGGAGGVIFGNEYQVTPGATYNLSVGAGGSGSSTSSVPGTDGGSSTFGVLTASGGGGGAGYGWNNGGYTANGRSGGSGGGSAEEDAVVASGGSSTQASFSGVSVYGNRGGNQGNRTGSQAGGGGGGAGGAGGDVPSSSSSGNRQPGNGGAAIQIGAGKTFTLAGGGGGGSVGVNGAGGSVAGITVGGRGGNNGSGTSGVANTGSGGGGGGSGSGGAGGSGIVVVVYRYYTITYAAGTFGTGSNQTATKSWLGSSTLANSATANSWFTRSGYTITGWSTNASGSSTTHSLGATYSADANLTLYPVWSSSLSISTPTSGLNGVFGQPYSLSIASAGGTGSKVFSLAGTLPSGLEFDTSTGVITGTPTEVKSINLTATVTDADSNSRSTSSFIVTIDSATALTPNLGSTTSFNGGFSFLVTNFDNSFSWTASSSAGSASIDANGLVSVMSLASGASATVTVTASRANYYSGSATKTGSALDIQTINFYKNDGSSDSASQTVTTSQATNLTSNSFSRSGYIFAGWTTNSDGTGTRYLNGQSVTLTSTLNLYARWLPSIFTLDFADQSQGTTDTRQYSTGTSVQLPSPSRTGYSLNGWYTSAVGGTRVGGGGDSYSPLQSRDLILLYELDTSLTFSGSGTTLNDISANLNTSLSGSINANIEKKDAATAAPTYALGDGGYLDLNTSSEHRIITQTSLTSRLGAGNTAVSVFMWVYPQSNDGVLISELGQTLHNSGWHDAQIEMVSGKIFFNVWPYDARVPLQTSNAITLNKWYYVGFTYSNSLLTAYVYDENGLLYSGSQSVTRLAPSNLFYGIGANEITRLGTGAYGDFRFGSLQVFKSGINSNSVALNYQSSCMRFYGEIGECTGQTLYAQWSANTLTINYDARSGSAPSGGSVSTTTGSIVSSLPTTTRDGYAFQGWFTAASGGTEITTSAAHNQTTNFTLYAQWSANTNRVTYNTQGGSAVASVNWTTATQLTLPATPTRAGYTFLGWFDTQTSGTKLGDASTSYSPSNTDSFTVYAQWSANTLTITYDARSGSAPSGGSASTTTGSTVSSLPTTTRSGYTFQGWFTAASGGTEITTSAAHNQTANFTLYAQWVADAQSITYNANTGNGSVGATSGVTDGTVTLASGSSLSRAGYTLSSWNTQADGLGTSYALSQSAVTMPAGGIALFAIWSANTNRVTYNTQGGSAVASVDWTTATQLTLPATPTRAGYTFLGWFDTATSGTKLGDASTSYSPSNTDSFTVFAQWSANTNRVTYNTQGGSSVDGVNWTTATQLTLPSAPTRAGYTFLGWFDTATSGTKLGDASTSYSPSNTDSFTVYAQWSANTNRVTYNTQGGSAVASVNWTTTTQLTLPATPTRAGYTFLGWFDTATLGTKLGDASTSYSPSNTDSFTVYAQWLANRNSVSFNSHGGSNVSSFDWFTATELELPLGPTRAGYGFSGWFDTSTAGTRLGGGGDRYMPVNSESVTGDEQWSPNQNRVLFYSQGGSEVASLEWFTASALTLPSAATRAGYSFTGWFDSSSAGIKLGDSASVITPGNTETFTAFAQWSINTYTITYNAGRNGISPRASDTFQVVDADLALPLPVRDNFTFEGWFDAPSAGNRIGGSGSSLRPLENKTLYAQWTQTSLYGVAPSALTELGEVRANNVARTSLSAEVDGSAISISVPAGSLPAGTVVKAQLVGDFSRASNLITSPGNFIFSMVVSWLTPDETVPNTAAGKPLALTITNSSIKAGSSIYSLLGSDVTFLGRATTDGTVTVELVSDPEIVIVAKVPDSPTAVSATSGENGRSVVTWSAPAINGGSDITGYTVTSSDGQICTTSGELSCTFIGLTNGTGYTFSVIAINAIGSSLSSDTSNVATPAAPAPISSGGGGFTPAPVVVTPSAPVQDSTGSNLASTPGQSRVIMNGTPVSAVIEVVAEKTITVKTGPVAINLQALTENRETKKLEEGSTLNFISREYAKVSGDGFRPQTTVRVWLLSTPRLLGEVQTDAQGRFDASLLFTVDIPLGNHTIQITGVSKENAVTAIAVGVTVSERVLQKVESVTYELSGDLINLTWTGNAKSTKITFQPSRGKQIIYLVENSEREFSIPGLRAGYVYQIRLEPLADPANNPFKVVKIGINPIAPGGIRTTLVAKDSLQVDWNGDPGSLRYEVRLFDTEREIAIQVTESNSLLFAVSPGTNYRIQISAIGDDTLVATSELSYSVPVEASKPKKDPKKPNPKPDSEALPMRSTSVFISISAKSFSKETKRAAASIRAALSKGDRLNCVLYLPQSRFTQGTVSNSLRKVVSTCSEVRRGFKGVRSFASVARAGTPLQMPKGTKYRLDFTIIR